MTYLFEILELTRAFKYKFIFKYYYQIIIKYIKTQLNIILQFDMRATYPLLDISIPIHNSYHLSLGYFEHQKLLKIYGN